jgi:ABC-type polysaccharide/polyol phosphate transport system ATPase subunit
MSTPVIRVENLGKEYVIGSRERGGETFREMLVSAAAAPFRRLNRLGGRKAADEESIWALRDVSFDVAEGEVVGIIGRNGAGKSTLLKILSRITEPTAGRVTIRGRVSSLLEVGTGFHPELTGRENIYLNGAILGMSRAEIKKKFDEIVDFSGVEKFLDTPVKRYSSGMSVRLAFAVAAHLEPEILIVDEVLAVGDVEFQRKCLGKMRDVAGSGRTVLFVSHNLPAVSTLCSTGILLRNGEMAAEGAIDKIIDGYLGMAIAGDTLRGNRVEIEAQAEIQSPESGVVLRFQGRLTGPLIRPHIALGLDNSEGVRVGTLYSETSRRFPDLSIGDQIEFQIATDPLPLTPGPMVAKIALAQHGEEIEVYDHALHINIPEYSPFTSPPHTRPRGTVNVTHSLVYSVVKNDQKNKEYN